MKVLFLGDYVDRGTHGPEVMSLLLSLKICFPNQIFLLRGNHECRAITEIYGFREQMINQYDVETYDRVIELFNKLPLAAIVNDEYLTCHGGISSSLTSLEAINQLDRMIEPPEEGLLSDLLWADPVSTKEAETTEYTINY